MKFTRVAPCLLFTALAVACGQQEQATPASTPTPAQTQSQPAAAAGTQEPKRFHLEGKIVAVKAEKNALSIDGKDIPGFMSAMTMDYSVRAKESLAGLGAGDEISADIVVPGGEPPYLENIKVTKKAGA